MSDKIYYVKFYMISLCSITNAYYPFISRHCIIMSKARYQIYQKSENLFELYEYGEFLVSFSRTSFRESVESLNRSSNCIGSILRIFPKQYPPPVTHTVRSDFEKLCDKLGESGLTEYMRTKGLKVVKKINISYDEIIKFLESKGYIIEGLVGDIYYDSRSNKAEILSARDTNTLLTTKALSGENNDYEPRSYGKGKSESTRCVFRP
jgi:hypothetical protein